MDLKKLKEESQTGSPKVVISTKAQPELKMRLIEEAEALGMFLSEYCELILSNRHDRETEIRRKDSENRALRAKLNESCHENELLKKENEDLRKHIKELQEQLWILTEPRLMQLFERVKGRRDIVENARGDDFPIEYRTTIDVLIALIYTTDLNL